MILIYRKIMFVLKTEYFGKICITIENATAPALLKKKFDI